MSPKLKIGLLVAVHIVAGLLFAWPVYVMGLESPLAVGAFFALVLAEAGLLGIWGALGTSRLWWRLPTVLATTTYLCVVVIVALKLEPGRLPEEIVLVLGVVFFEPAVVFVVLSALRHGRRQFHLVQSVALSPAAEGLRFTLRHLFLTTTIAAVMLAVGRGVGHVTGNGWETVFFIVIVVPCVVMVELSILWGALDIGRPVFRLLVAVLVAVFLGGLPPLYLKALVEPTLRDFLGWSSVMGIQATITAASLLVIRSNGWRLVSGANAVADSQPAPPGP